MPRARPTKPSAAPKKQSRPKKPKSLLKAARGTMIAFSPDDRRLSVRVGRAGQIWDLEAMAKVADLELPPHAKQIVFAPTGPLVASVNAAGTIAIHDSDHR